MTVASPNSDGLVGHREVVEAVGLLPSGGSLGCSIGSRVSRVRFPSVSDQATAAATLHHNTYRVHPRPIGGSLQCRWRARGGGAPFVEPLSRRWTSVAHQSGRATGELAFPFVDAETAARLADDGRMEQVVYSAVAFVVNDERVSKIREVRGASPGDGTQVAFSTHPYGWVSSAALFSAFWLWRWATSFQQRRSQKAGSFFWVQGLFVNFYVF